MKIGIMSSALGKMDLKQLAEKTGSYGFRTIHLNLKSIADIDTGAGKLSTGLANHIAEEFARHGVRIPALGGYTNLIHPDEEIRRTGIRRFKEQLRFARDFGASAVATETGTLNAENQYESHPDNQSEACWQQLRSVVAELAEEAERWGVFVALEGFTKNVVSTPERMERLLEEIGSSHLGIVMDPCNYIDETNMDRQEEVMDDAFRRLGGRILLAHAKDFRIEDGRMIQPAAGTGLLNYPHYLRLLTAAKPHVHLFLEHLAPERIFASLGHVTNHMAGVLQEEAR